MSQVAAVAVQGVILNIGNGSSPETMVPIVNVSQLTLPLKATVVDVSNVTNTWKNLMPTLLEIGNVMLDVFWVMTEPTHDNSGPYGLRYCMVHKTLKDFSFVYNDGNNSTDSFQAYVTGFEITGTQANMFKAKVTLSGVGAPSLV